MREVFCIKYQKKMIGLNSPPLGKEGQYIYENVSQQAWQEWLAHQITLINESHLDLADPKTRDYLNQQRDNFLNNRDYDKAGGYVPLQEKKE